MTFSSAVLLICTAVIAGSYGWGMRGSVIGGEKGAMLPGALIGMTLALFSGVAVIEDNWQLIAAAGCLGMGFGGFEPYGDTMSYILDREEARFNPSLGYRGLALKGANWFGVCGAFLGVSLSAFGGRFYKWYDFVLFIALMQPIQLLGIRIFNKPYDRKNKIFPKIYFSFGSREEWGGNLLMLVCLLAMMIVRGDWYSVLFSVSGMVFGAAGWLLAIKSYDLLEHRKADGTWRLPGLHRRGLVDGWKTMEFTLGASGALGLSLYFVLSREWLTENLADVIAGGSRFDPLGTNGEWIGWAAFAFTLLMAVQYPLAKILGKKAERKGKKYNDRPMELLERTAYFGVALGVVLLGSMRMARLVVFCLLLWVVTEKDVFERLDERIFYHPKAAHWAMIALFAAGVAGEILLPNGYTPLMCLLMYSIYYIFCEMLHYYSPKVLADQRRTGKKSRYTSKPLIFSTFGVQCAVVIVLYAIFAAHI